MSAPYVWGVTIGLFVATYLIRFSFLGLFGAYRPGPLAGRLLRYVPSAVLPALIAPMVTFERGGGFADPHVMGAALVALAVGVIWRNLLATLIAAMAAYHALAVVI